MFNIFKSLALLLFMKQCNQNWMREEIWKNIRDVLVFLFFHEFTAYN